MSELDPEIAICRGLAHRAAFVVGFARSNTTIVLRIINTAPRALLLGEANVWAPHQIPRFRDWYNEMHGVVNGSQVSKSSFAPDFIPGRNHDYAEWMQAALDHYDLTGEKLAFTAQHFAIKAQEDIRAFYEARFFTSRYIFLFRDPVQTLLSTLRLMKADNPAVLRREMTAWLTYVQLWADFIRTFPNTMTLAGDIDQVAVSSILEFLDLSSPGAALLLDAEEKVEHAVPSHLEDLARHREGLSGIYQHIQNAIGADPAYREAGQNRDLARNDTRRSASSPTRTKPRDLGQAWAKAEALKATLASEASAEATAA